MSGKEQSKKETKEIEMQILKLCANNLKGMLLSEIQENLSAVDVGVLQGSLNGLIAKSKIDLLRKSDGAIMVKVKQASQSSTQPLVGSDMEEKVVYNIVQDCGSQGIWSKEIRAKSNLHSNLVNKVLTKLENKKLIKSFFAVTAPKQKRYILYNLQPDQSLTGGAWYTENQLDTVFIDIITEQCFEYLRQKAIRLTESSGDSISLNAAFATSKEILQYINQRAITKVELKVEEIDTLMEILVRDDKVETMLEGGLTLYKAYLTDGPVAVHTSLCSICPNNIWCKIRGSISPETCKYFQDW